MSVLRRLERLSRILPRGVEVYVLGVRGDILLADDAGARRLAAGGAAFLRFIDEGQFARYLVGDARTSPERPCNATYKLGVVDAHSAFTPHAHRGEHVVTSLGYAECALHDATRDRAVRIRLGPQTMIRIPAMMPHSFGNRGSSPLLILAANTGFGIDHSDYAITAAEAERRAVGGTGGGSNGAAGAAADAPAGAAANGTAANGTATDGTAADGTADDYATLGAALRRLERQHRAPTTGGREGLAAGLRRFAAWLEGVG